MYNSDYDKRKQEKWRELMPENNYDRHINNAEMYRNAVENLEWSNKKGRGERWNMDDIIRRSDIDFNRERFTPYDYAYMVNARHADYSNTSDRPEHFMQMAKEDLHNNSFPERADERAYYDAQSRRRNYNYSNNYRNEYNRYDDGMRFDSYDNRRNYNERGSYRDRDNDGRYNE